MSIRIVVLAAGQGKRMKSALPKVLHTIGGKPMLVRVLDAAAPLSEKPPIVIHGSGASALKAALSNRDIDWVLQSEQRGTGHAVIQALPYLEDSELVIILCADVPLIRTETLENLAKKARSSQGFSVLTVMLEEPEGYGRIFCKEDGIVEKIVESVDLEEADRKISECNSGIFAIEAGYLKRWLPNLKGKNLQNELYLTDCVFFATEEKVKVVPLSVDQPNEVLGVNDKKQLAQAERAFQNRMASDLLESGVTLLDPSRLDVRGELLHGRDVTIDINVIFEGRVVLGDGVYVGPNSIVKNSEIGENSVVREHCVLDSVSVGADCRIGPFCRLRPNTKLSREVTVGNFVEIKNSKIEEKSKVNHLSYVGDSDIGQRVNIGAGTITCNYDGANKSKTIIESDVFVGSNTELIAPVKISSGSTIGAGSTVTKDVEDNALVVSRVAQKNIVGWKRPKKDGSREE